jgi:hypothetical protein
VHVWRNTEARSRNSCCCETAISITHFCMRVCACVRGWVHAILWVGCTGAGVYFRACRHTYTACYAHAPYCLRPLWFHHIFRRLINGTISEKKVAEHKRCVSIFPTSFIWNVSYYKMNSAICCHERVHVKYLLFCRILMKLEFSRQISEKKAQISNFINIRPVGSELFHADGQTNMTKLSLILQFCTRTWKAGVTTAIQTNHSKCKRENKMCSWNFLELRLDVLKTI